MLATIWSLFSNIPNFLFGKTTNQQAASQVLTENPKPNVKDRERSETQELQPVHKEDKNYENQMHQRAIARQRLLKRMEIPEENKKLPDVCFLHIPKTGGKTMRSRLVPSMWVHHFSHTIDDYLEWRDEGKTIVTVLRNPNNRYISEWLHYVATILKLNPKLERGRIPDMVVNQRLKETKIQTIEDFIQWKPSHNTQMKFLLGWGLYSAKKVKKRHFDQVRKRIESGQIKIILLEFLEKDRDLLTSVGNDTHIGDRMLAMKTQQMKAELGAAEPDLNDELRKVNKMDWKLYDYVYSQKSREYSQK
jgi:hypothetical protein